MTCLHYLLMSVQSKKNAKTTSERAAAMLSTVATAHARVRINGHTKKKNLRQIVSLNFNITLESPSFTGYVFQRSKTIFITTE